MGVEWVTIGPCKLACGDALEILPTLEAGSVDAVATDPPYSSGGMVRGDRMASTRVKYQSSDADREHPNFTGDNRDQRGWVEWVAIWMTRCAAICKPGAMACLFTDWRQLPCTTDALQAGGWVWRGIVPWDKVNARPMPNRFKAQCEYLVWGTNGPRDFSTAEGAVYHPGVFRFAPPTGNERIHSTQKPVAIMETIVAVARPDGVVLDPFLGSGTTALACVRAGRRFVGIEKSPEYFDIACKRIEKAVADTALLSGVA